MLKNLKYNVNTSKMTKKHDRWWKISFIFNCLPFTILHQSVVDILNADALVSEGSLSGQNDQFCSVLIQNENDQFQRLLSW